MPDSRIILAAAIVLATLIAAWPLRYELYGPYNMSHRNRFTGATCRVETAGRPSQQPGTSIATLLVVNHTNLIVDKRPPKTPPGTTFNAANDAGAQMTPSQPESPIKLLSVGPKPADHPPIRSN
jgi:hypothetical protein